jgi:hypothetical protein
MTRRLDGIAILDLTNISARRIDQDGDVLEQNAFMSIRHIALAFCFDVSWRFLPIPTTHFSAAQLTSIALPSDTDIHRLECVGLIAQFCSAGEVAGVDFEQPGVHEVITECL